MNRKLAENINDMTEEIIRNLDNSVRLVMEQESDEDFRRYRLSAGRAMGIIYWEIQRLIHEEYPDLTPPGLRKE